MDYKNKTTGDVVSARKTTAPCDHAGLSVDEGFWVLSSNGKDIPVALREEKFFSEYEAIKVLTPKPKTDE